MKSIYSHLTVVTPGKIFEVFVYFGGTGEGKNFTGKVSFARNLYVAILLLVRLEKFFIFVTFLVVLS